MQIHNIQFRRIQQVTFPILKNENWHTNWATMGCGRNVSTSDVVSPISASAVLSWAAIAVADEAGYR